MKEMSPSDDELERLRQKRLREMQESSLQKDSGKIIEVNDANLMSTVNSHAFVVIDFWAEWCGPCRMVSPVIEELAREYAGRVTFAKCNVDENNRSAAGFNIAAIPTILLFANGQMVERITGAHPKNVIESRIRKAFGVA
jgi:thioredoxin 1